jgi:hypothetical protein
VRQQQLNRLETAMFFIDLLFSGPTPRAAVQAALWLPNPLKISTPRKILLHPSHVRLGGLGGAGISIYKSIMPNSYCTWTNG